MESGTKNSLLFAESFLFTTFTLKLIATGDGKLGCFFYE